MYGVLRFLYENFITAASMLTPSTQNPGQLSGVVKAGTGVATLILTGDFSGVIDAIYTIEIDSVSAGTSVGEATFKWKRDYDATWQATGVLTRTTPVIVIAGDVELSFIGGYQDDFALGDTFTFRASATYGKERLIDRNRNTYWQADGTSANIVIDLGSAQAVTAFILQDHNLTAVTLEANSADSWGAPAYSYVFSTITDPLVLYLSQTYRYWRVVCTSTSDCEIANLYLGDYAQLSKVNASWGSLRGDGYYLQTNTSEAGVMRRYAYARSRTLELTFPNTLVEADIDIFLEMQDEIVNTGTYRVLPFWLHLFADSYADLTLMEWENLAEFSRAYFQYLLYSGVTMRLKEAVKV